MVQIHNVSNPIILLGHDNKGMMAAWHLDKVEVRRLTEGGGFRSSSASNDGRHSSASNSGSLTHVFPCARWLAKGEDDGAIVRELVPAKVLGIFCKSLSLRC